MPHLLNVWPSVGKRLREAERALLLFDYDGTLTPIVPEPDRAILPEETRELLARLSRHDRYLLGVISGRGLRDVAARVGVEGMIYAGNHGLEIQGPGIDYTHPEAAQLQPVLALAYQELLERMTPLPGVIVEHKGLTLSVHYRMTPEDLEGRVEEMFAAAVAPFLESGKVRITRGKKVLEVRPNVAWDKGKAIARLRATYTDTSLAVFFGDDRTDEDGFAVVQEAGGIAVFVGPPGQPTQARYRLDSAEEVAQTLHLLEQL